MTTAGSNSVLVSEVFSCVKADLIHCLPLSSTVAGSLSRRSGEIWLPCPSPTNLPLTLTLTTCRCCTFLLPNSSQILPPPLSSPSPPYLLHLVSFSRSSSCQANSVEIFPLVRPAAAAAAAVVCLHSEVFQTVVTLSVVSVGALGLDGWIWFFIGLNMYI